MSHIADSTHAPPTLFHQPRPFKNAEQSKKCWETRNIFYGCLDKNNTEKPPEWSPERKEVIASHGADKMMCRQDREEFEHSCARDWVGYFNRRRVLECRMRDFDGHAAEELRQHTEKTARKTLDQHLAEGGK